MRPCKRYFVAKGQVKKVPMAGHELVGFQTIALELLYGSIFLWYHMLKSAFVISCEIPLTLPNTNKIVVGKMSESSDGGKNNICCLFSLLVMNWTITIQMTQWNLECYCYCYQMMLAQQHRILEISINEGVWSLFISLASILKIDALWNSQECFQMEAVKSHIGYPRLFRPYC